MLFYPFTLVLILVSRYAGKPMTEKLQLRLRGVNICDRTLSSYDARLIGKLWGGFWVRVKFTPRHPDIYSARTDPKRRMSFSYFMKAK